MATEIQVGDIVRWNNGKGGIGVVEIYESVHQKYSDIKYAWVRAVPGGQLYFIPFDNFGTTEVVGHVGSD